MKSATFKLYSIMILIICTFSLMHVANFESNQIVIVSDARYWLYELTVATIVSDSYLATRIDYPLISAPQDSISFSNSNTSNLVSSWLV